MYKDITELGVFSCWGLQPTVIAGESLSLFGKSKNVRLRGDHWIHPDTFIFYRFKKKKERKKKVISVANTGLKLATSRSRVICSSD